MHCSRNPAKGTNEQNPAGTPFRGARFLGAASFVQESEDSGSRFSGSSLALLRRQRNYTSCDSPVQSGWACRPQPAHGRHPDEDLLGHRPDVPTVPGHASRSARGSKGEGVSTTRVRTAEARRARRPARSGLARSASVGQTLRPRRQERINAANAAHKPSRPAHYSTRPRSKASPSGRVLMAGRFARR